MLSIRNFWRRHKRKVLYTAGVLGSGYLLYKLYDTHKRRLYDLERELESQQENDELVKAQLQAHFDNIQKIVDTMTLPHAMHYLSGRIAEELDLSHLTEMLMKGKGQPNTLTSSEKLELWDRLKILSFTRMVLSLWAMTVLSLYIRVQVNILGRHLYIDAARSLGNPILIEAADPIDSHDQQKFLASSDFLANSGLPALISDIEAAATEVLKGKQLRDFFNSATLHETIVQILDMFMSMGSPNHWVDHLMPGDTRQYETNSNGDGNSLSDFTRFGQFMMETHAVLSSTEFRDVAEVSLKSVVVAVMEDIEAQFGGNFSSGIALAKLLPRVAQMGPFLLEDPSRKRFIQIIRNVPEVETFFTILYASMPNA